jgi:hypothetical protein
MNNRKTFKLTLLAAAMASAHVVAPGTAWAAGNATVGPLFTMPSVTPNGTPFSIVRTDSNAFMLAWTGATQDGTGAYVYNNSVQSFSSDGTPLSSVIRLADNLSLIDSSLSKVNVAKDSDGDFIASWISSSPKKVYLQRFSQSGVAQGNPVTMASAPQTSKYDWSTNTFSPMVAVDTDGDLAVSWTVNPSLAFGWCWGNLYTGWIHGCFGGDTDIVYASVYNTSGSTMRWKGTGIITTKKEIPIALLPQPIGNFLELSLVPSPNPGDSYGSVQLLNSHAQKVGAAWKPMDPGGNPETISGITGADTDANGDVAIVWQPFSASSDSSVYLRRYSANGTPLGDRITVANVTSIQLLNCFVPIVKMAPSGMFVVLWGDEFAATPCGIKGQYFNADGSLNGAAFTVTDTDFVTYYGPPAAAIDSSGNLTVVWGRFPVDEPWTVAGRNISAPH